MAQEIQTPLQQQTGGASGTDQTARLQVATQAILEMQEHGIAAIERLAGVADKSASNLLLAFGVVLALTSWVSDSIVANVPLAHSLPSADFIAVQAVAIAALAGGAAIRVYAFKRQEDAAEASRRTTATGMEKVVELHHTERIAELDVVTSQHSAKPGQPKVGI